MGLFGRSNIFSCQEETCDDQPYLLIHLKITLRPFQLLIANCTLLIAFLPLQIFDKIYLPCVSPSTFFKSVIPKTPGLMRVILFDH